MNALRAMPTGVPSGLLERPSGLPARPAPSLLRTLEASEMSELCDVCGFDTEPDNLIVYCGSCNMGVHQTCYGISQVESEEVITFKYVSCVRGDAERLW